MRGPGKRGSAFAWAAVSLFACWGIGFVLSCLLQPRRATLSAGQGSEPILAALLGETRVLMSAQFLQSADTYFHRGVARREETAFENNIFQRVAERISPRVHTHVGGSNIREIMPWLWMAIRTNPSDLSPYLIASYWLSREVGKPELAQEVLQEGFRRNPHSCRILFEQGALHVRLGQREEAEGALTAALALWPGDADPESKEAVKTKQEILTYRALIHEVNGNLDGARRDLEDAARIGPDGTDGTDLQRWIRQLRAGGRRAQEVMGTWNALLITRRDDVFPDHDDHENEYEH